MSEAAQAAVTDPFVLLVDAIQQRQWGMRKARQIAVELSRAARRRGFPLTAAIVFVSDRPRLALTTATFLQWCERKKIVASASNGASTHECE